MNTKQVIERYRDQKPNRARGGVVEWSNGTGSVSANRRVLKSYSTPMAVALPAEGEDKPSMFLKNGAKYSITTSSHQSEIQMALPGPTVAFPVLEAALGLWWSDALRRDDIIDWQADRMESVLVMEGGGLRHREWDNASRRWQMGAPFRRNVGALMWVRDEEETVVDQDGNPHIVRNATWHTLGGCLLYYGNAHYLCTLDESTYCTIQLRGKPRTIAAALKSLKPPVVQRAEKEGLTVQRQGEWFFIDRQLTDADMVRMTGSKTKTALYDRNGKYSVVDALPIDATTGSRNQHVCRYARVRGKLYATRVVRHLNIWHAASREHREIKLGDGWWWEVAKNTEVRSWTGSGRMAGVD